jgi:hypothetical protein
VGRKLQHSGMEWGWGSGSGRCHAKGDGEGGGGRQGVALRRATVCVSGGVAGVEKWGAAGWASATVQTRAGSKGIQTDSI